MVVMVCVWVSVGVVGEGGGGRGASQQSTCSHYNVTQACPPTIQSRPMNKDHVILCQNTLHVN